MRGSVTRTLALALLISVALLAGGSALAWTGDAPKMQVRLEWPAAAQLSTLQTMPDLDPMKVLPGREIILVQRR